MIDLKLEVVHFANEDVIATSAGPLTGKSGSFYIPSGQYNSGALGGNYVQFNGTFGDYSAGGYNITNISGAAVESGDERDGLMSGGSYYFPDVKITVDMSDLAPIAKQYYDAFSYSNGQYYSNGVSYYEQYWQ